MATHDISLMGAVFPDVPKVVLPVDGGGSATFTDVSDTTAAAADVASGKYFYTSDGTKTAGTASGGGGGGGLVYETGTYTPASDTARPTISFANTHTTLPIYVMLYDAVGTYDSTTNSNYYFAFNNFADLFGKPLYSSSSSIYYTHTYWAYRSSNQSLININVGTPQTFPTSDTANTVNSYPRYFVDEESFRPYTNSTSRYWRTGRTYKWIAVWAPTT